MRVKFGLAWKVTFFWMSKLFATERKERFGAGDSMRANDEVWSRRLFYAALVVRDDKNDFHARVLFNGAESRWTHNSVARKHSAFKNKQNLVEEASFITVNESKSRYFIQKSISRLVDQTFFSLFLSNIFLHFP